MDADSSVRVSADLVLVALSASRSHPPPARPRRAKKAGPPLFGPVRSTPERTIVNGSPIRGIGKNVFCLPLQGRVARVAKHCRAEPWPTFKPQCQSRCLNDSNFQVKTVPDSDSDSESKSL